ncbi:MAG TPA: DUF1549 and DUF1553 domain-containing protein [Planctomycetota bacterium]|nr:DUF1549 and DUF1553 domain-containing protein [Planctomycetota bacterium]
MRAIRWGILALAAVTQPGAGGDELPAVDRRLDARPEETPSFQRHVLPLFSRLGCNGRACHGSFQGQGGFRLSLFGYDFASDHDALVAGEEPRVLTKNPPKSRLLLKPTTSIAHKGGKRLEVDSWQYRLLQRWIKAGAPSANEADELLTLEVDRKEIVFSKPGDRAALRVVARWADGTREDVTPLCRFRTNDESIATVDAAGTITAVGKGDTHVVAFYDNGVAPVHVLLPATDRTGARFPDVPAPTRVDQLVVEKLRKLGVVPSGLCTDAEFLRRVSLDMTGTLPSAPEVRAFLADARPDKRARKIDELLERPAYAAWWATRLCDLTGNSPATGPQGSEQALNAEKSRQWYQWVYRRVRENVPYDDLIEGIALAVGKTLDQTYDQYCEEMSSYFRKDKPADFSGRPTMPYFWTRRNAGSPEAKALSFANAFLGLSLQCAQCHKHPYDQWTKQDFDQFTAFFSEVKYTFGPRERTKEMYKAVNLEGDEDDGAFKRKFMDLLAQGKVLPFKELVVPGRSKAAPKPRKPDPKLGRVITPKLLGGEEVVGAKYDDPRRPVMDWMRQADNPYFATSWVNRVWANYFGKGLIEPTDDLNLANPPSHPGLLDHLAQGFIKSGYDMKWLHREIANSRTYQLSRQTNETNAHDERNFSRAVIRRLHAEAAVDALTLATLSDDARKALDADPVPARAIGLAGNVGGGRRDGSAYSLALFGKPARELNCDCERSIEPSLLQTVYLRNDAEVLKMLDRKDGWLQQVKSRDPAAVVEDAFLRTLSRPPTSRERAVAMNQDPRDLMWALLNTKEFILNH